MILPCLLLFVVAAVDAGEAAAPPDWLKVQVHIEAGDAGLLSVGEPFHLVIEAEHAAGELALLPEDLGFGDQIAERKNARRHTRSGDSKKEVDRYELELLAFEAGDVTIPKIPLALGSTRAETNPIALDVKTHFSEAEMPIATSTQPEAMAELEKMAAADPDAKVVLVDDYRPLLIGGGIVTAALAAWIAYRLWKKRKEAIAQIPIPAPPPRPAHEIALERLHLLRQKGLIEKNELKPFFVELSEIVRAYTGLRWGFDSLDLTIDELMLELKKHDARGLDVHRLENLLMRADLVKFAKFVPEKEEATNAMGEAVEIVEKTKLAAVTDAGARPSPEPGPPNGGRHAAA